ncbi:transcription termination/antitermination protein NusG [Methylacidimicrobium sp. B4]|uniref:transcription termination/antitermination protein NusG n=1 Tax=Methylacidimicrobium sp. B4 TaxID=2796139 RepID=UPI001A8F12E2|nr:transcription termination/antitermination NusG family protein [Methylacidimicrobium sp. B4]QSR85422.1 transcriptional activator RfaH [Methylacidimicrobium sp. B4]
MFPPGERLWFCLRAQPKRERIAQESLLRLDGVEALLPLIRYGRLRQGKRVCTTEPLFPGYLFARFEPLVHLNAVRYAQGVAKIVQFGGRYPHIPSSAADHLREILGPENLLTLECRIEPGMEVKIGAGPFSGIGAVVREYLPGKERVRILLDWLGRQLETEIPAAVVVLPDSRLPRMLAMGAPEPPKKENPAS